MSFSEWKKYKLGDVCTKIGSGATPRGGKESYSDEGEYALIRSQNVLDFTFSYSGLAFINETQANKLSNVELEKDDVLLNITGDSVARVCQVPTSLLPARVNQHVAIIRPEKKILDSFFLKYYLLNPSCKNYLLNISAAGATRNAITKGMIENLEIYLPELKTQQKIASILSSLDDKIELNNKTNQTLEAMAQSLLKEMCLPISEIPDGWRIGKLGEIMQNFDSKRKPLSSREREKRKGEYPYYGAASIVDYVDDYLFDGVYLLLGEDGSVITSDEKPILQYVTGKFWVNNHTHVLRGIKDYSTEFLYLLLKNTNVKKLVTGAVQPKINQGNMNGLEIVIPPNKVVQKINELVKPLFENILNNQDENQTLSNLRNDLIPKFFKGEIKI